MTVFFTADTHFGHANIINLCKRPFTDVDEMDRVMIQRWNTVVKPIDTVWHLGDFAWHKPDEYAKQLNGEKHLIIGNHDPKRMDKMFGWHSINHYKELKVDGRNLVLFHYGMRVWNKCHHGAIHLYGHSHGNLAGDSQSLDVGVDAWMFQPITLDSIEKRLAALPKRSEPDHHKKLEAVA